MQQDFFLDQVPDLFRDCRLVQELKKYGLVNKNTNCVKVIYSPQFLSEENTHIKMDYLNFIRGCDLGIFLSHYEPWGYTPIECIIASVPVVTTNASGFGQYIASHLDSDRDTGIFIVDRTKLDAANDLFEILKKFVVRNEDYSETLRQCEKLVDWKEFIPSYDETYMQATNP